MVVCDRGAGFERARRKAWKDTRAQRCTFHAFSQIKRYTTTRPKLEAGKELYRIAKILLRVESLSDAKLWTEPYTEWCVQWEEFLHEKACLDERNWAWTHERLVNARKSLNTPISENTLFAYLDPELTADGPLPATNNKIEGGVSTPLRQLLREHRGGMNTERRVEAVFWWCHMHSENPLSPAVILKSMPTDKDIDALYRKLASSEGQEGPQEWGTGIDWNDFRHSLPYRMDWD